MSFGRFYVNSGKVLSSPGETNISRSSMDPFVL